ncbi:hypothetical protein E4U55_006610 [Claviceps digitariae]|nr:hypothetical protein E4U55_006610 [Claviceps digitariae]
MVKIASIFIAALAAIAPVAQANPCTEGVKYCGKTLKAYGDYNKKVHQTLIKALGYEPNPVFQADDRTLFKCLAGGEIEYMRMCSYACIDGGGGENDYCTFD